MHLIVPQRREREQSRLSAMGLTTGLGGAVVNSLLWFLDSFLAFFLERFDNTEKTNHKPDLTMALEENSCLQSLVRVVY